MLQIITTFNNIPYVILFILWIQSVICTSENSLRTTVTDEEFNAETLITLNNYRKLHGVPRIEFDSQLAEKAATWATKLQDKASNDGKLVGYFSHPTVEGENVMVRTNDSGTADGAEAINQWYSEIKDFDFSKNQFLYETGQFTQLVWKNTKYMGIAKVHDSGTNYTVFVARFKPPAHIGNASVFQENVLPLLTDPTTLDPDPSDLLATNSQESSVTVSPELKSKENQVAKPNLDGRNIQKKSSSGRRLEPIDMDALVENEALAESVIETSSSEDVDETEIEVTTGDSFDVTTAPRDAELESGTVVINNIMDDDEGLKTPGKWLQDALLWHNILRERHGSNPLKLDSKLCEKAEETAANLARLSEEEGRVVLKRSPNLTGDGENLAGTSGKRGTLLSLPGGYVIKHWYTEIKNHDWKRNFYQLDSGHFSQIIWSSTTALGCARAVSPHGFLIVVCRYHPGGNYGVKKAYDEHVLPPVDEDENSIPARADFSNV